MSKPAAPKFDTATYTIGTHDAAWSFMRACHAGGLRDGKRGPWLSHRAYVVGSDGIVRRTDRSPRPCRKCGWPHVGEACVTA